VDASGRKPEQFRLSGQAMTADDIPWGTKQHVFERLGEGQYRLEIPEAETVFEIDRLHRDRSRDLCGEAQVSCMLAGAKTYRGTLFSGSINLSDAYRRRDVASRLRTKASTGNQIDWDAVLDELSYRVVEAEREGRPAQLLSSFKAPQPDDAFNIHGIVLPRHHPSLLFGDGGTFKSYLALYIAGCLAQQGLRVLFADWELEGEDHRGRLEKLFGAAMPPVYYQRCLRPLVDEIDGLKRQVSDHQIDYLVADSVGFATDGAPESAEAAMGYFRALRQLRIGSLHLAHVTKQAEGAPDPVKPFGSTFWHNSARATWFAKRVESGDGQRFVVALFIQAKIRSSKKQDGGSRIQVSIGFLSPKPIVTTLLKVGDYERIFQSEAGTWTGAAEAVVNDLVAWWQANQAAFPGIVLPANRRPSTAPPAGRP
jgi:hypothetical protein